MKYFIYLSILISIIQAGDFTACTDEMPPYNYKKNGKVIGYSVAKLKDIMKKNGSEFSENDIKYAPWSRCYNEVLINKKSILFSTARIPSKEKQFKWVGPIDIMNIGVIAKKSKNIKIDKIADFEKYSIGTLNDSGAESLLVEKGIPLNKLDRFFDINAQLKKLVSGRIDMLAFSVPALYYLLEEMGVNSDEYETVYLIKEVGLYYAFSNDTDEKIIIKLNSLLKK